MGANASKNSGKSSKNISRIQQQKIDDLVDLGAVFPNGLYTTTTEQDYDPRAVRNLIIARKIAPFYKGLEDAPETVTPTPPLSSPPLPQTLSPPPLPQTSSSLSTISFDSPPSHHQQKRPAIVNRPRSASSSSRKESNYDPFLERKKAYMEKMKQREKMLYNDAVECPICFLYYPANINFSRCCDQPICTECFVQIHRPLETPSVPATCPFCMEDNYGIIYETPSWSEKFQARSRSGSHSTVTGTRHTTSGVSEDGPRRESVSHKNPDVVLVDHVRPNWKNLIPPSSNNARTVSRRNSASVGSSRGNNLLRATGVSTLLTRPGRSASSAAATEYNQYLTTLRDGNMDLEDWMVMEAIRLSLAEQEEHERKEALRKCKQLEEENNKSTVEQESSSSSSSYLPGPAEYIQHESSSSSSSSSSGSST